MRILLLFLLGALLGVERAPTPALIRAPGPLQLSRRSPMGLRLAHGGHQGLDPLA
jgi:hypothetical protein